MKMMRFTKVTEDIREALFQFCMEQAFTNSYVGAEEIEILMESAFAVLDRIKPSGLPVVPVYRYQLYAGEQFTDEILPQSIKENGVLYDRSVCLGTFALDSYSDTAEQKTIIRGYDVVYDLDSGGIRLLYKISIADDSVKTLYRVDTDLYEDFDVYKFIIDLTSQISTRLKQSLCVVQCGKEAA